MKRPRGAVGNNPVEDADHSSKLKKLHGALFIEINKRLDYCDRDDAYAAVLENKELEGLGFTSASCEPELMASILEIRFQQISLQLAGTGTIDETISRLHRARTVAYAMRAAILHASPLPVPGSTTLKYYPALPNVERVEKLTPVVLRPEDEEFWQSCLENSDKQNVCGVGAPGIGKTTTTFHLIKTILIQKQKPVVYAIQANSKTVYTKFDPIVSNGNVVDIWISCVETDQEPEGAHQWSDGDYYLVDPGMTNRSCYAEFTRRVHVILVASCDSRHWGGKEFSKMRSRGGILPTVKAGETVDEIVRRLKEAGVGSNERLLGGKFIYCRSWALKDIIDSKYLLNIGEVSDEEISARYRITGGSVRRVIDFKDSTTQEQEIQNSLAILSDKTVQELADGRCNAAFDVTAPASTLVSVEPKEYNPCVYQMSICSDFAEELIAKKHLKLSWFAVLNEENSGNLGNLFEAFLRQKLSSPVDLKMDRQSSPNLPPKGSSDEKKKYIQSSRVIKFPSRNVIRVTNLVESVKMSALNSATIFYSKDESQPLIDMICRFDGGFLAIQVTIQHKQTVQVHKMRTLLKALGPLEVGEKLVIVYVVPRNRLEDFETKPVNPLEDTHLASQVEIYHVGIDVDQN